MMRVMLVSLVQIMIDAMMERLVAWLQVMTDVMRVKLATLL